MSDASKDPEGTEPPAPTPDRVEEPALPAAEARTEAEDAGSPAATQPKSGVAGSEDDTPLDAAGRERPRFLLAFPPDPELARLSAAFEAGNYALVRAEAGRLAERTESPAVRTAALELRRRIEPDPLLKYILALTAALLLLLAYWAYHH